MKATRQIILPVLFFLVVCWGDNPWVSAFAMGHHRSTNVASTCCGPRSLSYHPATTESRARASGLRAGAQNNDGPGDSFSELTSALARLDKEQQQSKSRWSKLILPREAEEHETDGLEGSAIEQGAKNDAGTPSRSSTDYVWMLEPHAGRAPSVVIVFTGGAGLGQFPNVAYNELLSRVSDRMNALVLAAHYSVGLDHFQLAKQTGELIRRALVYCQDDPERPYMSADKPLPTYSLAHSLGCKLQTIYMVATRQDYLDGMGFMAYNNFSFAKTLKMARTFTEELRQTTTRARMGRDSSTKMPFGNLDSDSVINGIFNFAEMAAGAIGVDFAPNAEDTERLIQLRYDDLMQAKTRVFVFDDDNMDSSPEFLRACSGGSAEDDSSPSVSGLPGGHLSPVFFQWKIDDVTSGLDGDGMPPEARELAKEAMGGFQGASFGDEVILNELVDEICDWILGKPPKRGPIWAQDDNAYNYQGGAIPRISDGR